MSRSLTPTPERSFPSLPPPKKKGKTRIPSLRGTRRWARNDYSNFSSKGVSRVSVFHPRCARKGNADSFHPFEATVPPFSGRGTGRSEKRGRRKRAQPQKELVTPPGHGVNTVLPTINSLLPCFLSPEQEGEKGQARGLPPARSRVVFLPPFRGFLRNLSFFSRRGSSPAFYFISRFFFAPPPPRDSFPGYWWTYARVQVASYLRTGEKTPVLGATVDLTPEKNRATPSWTASIKD